MKFILLFLALSCASQDVIEGPTLWDEYEKVMLENPHQEKHFECKEADLSKNPEAQNYQKTIRKDMSGINRPNFGGMYRLIEIQRAKDSIWFVGDCKSGLILNTKLEGHLMFSMDSIVLIKNPPKMGDTKESYQMPIQGLPEIYRLNVKSEKFELLPNKIQPANN